MKYHDLGEVKEDSTSYLSYDKAEAYVLLIAVNKSEKLSLIPNISVTTKYCYSIQEDVQNVDFVLHITD